MGPAREAGEEAQDPEARCDEEPGRVLPQEVEVHADLLAVVVLDEVDRLRPRRKEGLHPRAREHRQLPLGVERIRGQQHLETRVQESDTPGGDASDVVSSTRARAERLLLELETRVCHEVRRKDSRRGRGVR